MSSEERPEYLSYQERVHAASEHPRSGAMAEDMWGDAMLQACALGQVTDHLLYAVLGQRLEVARRAAA